MEVVYRRPPDRVRRLRQELLHDGEDWKATLLLRPPEAAPWTVGDGVRLEGGSALLWFTFPGRWYEVAAFHGPDGSLLGHYTNLVRPPEASGSTWRIRDLFLDVWQPAEDGVRLLDRDEFREAAERGWLDPEEAARAEAESRRILELARAGEWPPEVVRAWPLESVPALRLRRDRPGTYWASLASSRIIAFGLYFLGAASVVSLVFATFTDAFRGDPTGLRWWLGSLAGAGALLLPATLAGKLPATRFPRPSESLTDERSLFIAALASGLAVLVLNEGEEIRALLAGLYATLGLFLAIFAACRAWFDRTLPLYAATGLAVCLFALFVLL